MNRRNIERNISRKINNWCKFIDDPDLVKDIKRDVVVTGGCITSMLLNEDINDYDVYFKTEETTYKVAKYYVDKWNNKRDKTPLFGKIHVFRGSNDFLTYKNICVESYKDHYKPDSNDVDPNTYEAKLINDIGKLYDDRVYIYVPSAGVVGNFDYNSIDDFENFKSKSFNDSDNKDSEFFKKEKKDPEYKTVFMSSNAITLSDGIQIIVRFFGEPEEIHKNFDFIHTHNYYVNGELVTTTQALEATLAKQLIFTNSKYPLTSLIRLRKFIKRGWYVSAGEILKIVFKLREFDLTDVNILKDQLLGCDSAYFLFLLSKINEDKIKNENLQIDAEYIVKLVDKIF